SVSPLQYGPATANPFGTVSHNNAMNTNTQ
ncbi:unnamed protein product, partial [marine sediment metagenome]